jgi:hypothetical protein
LLLSLGVLCRAAAPALAAPSLTAVSLDAEFATAFDSTAARVHRLFLDG